VSEKLECEIHTYPWTAKGPGPSIKYGLEKNICQQKKYKGNTTISSTILNGKILTKIFYRIHNHDSFPSWS
jgi:hypothetical protein